MTQSSMALPLGADFKAALQNVELLWNLVPRSARPLHKNLREELVQILGWCARYAESRASIETTDAGDAEGEGEGSDESPLAIVMRMMRSLSPEQFLQVKILMMMRDLSDEGRFEMFEEIGGSHHLACGGEVFPDEVHECDLEDRTDESEDTDGDADTSDVNDTDKDEEMVT